jgi:hypothetical protein
LSEQIVKRGLTTIELPIAIMPAVSWARTLLLASQPRSTRSRSGRSHQTGAKSPRPGPPLGRLRDLPASAP